MLKRLALGAVAAWAACGFLAEMGTAVSGWDRRQGFAGPAGWRFHAPEADALARTLAAARTLVPPGAMVAFAAPDDPPGMEFTAKLWAAYLLPGNDVVLTSDPAALRQARFAVGFRREIRHPRAEPLRQLPDGWLYRVTPP